ncbi:MAG: glutaredoxin [Rickettsiaceae bacterium]|nr:glutaredoxin [Rickettsiaceae bacterium]
MSSYIKLAQYKSFIIICLLIFSGISVMLLMKSNDTTQPSTKILPQPPILLYIREGCFYCKLATQLLEEKALHYEIIELSNNEALYTKLVNSTGQTTVPYIFINGQFIGGYSDLRELDEENKL